MQIDTPISIRFMHSDPVVSAGISALLARWCTLDLIIDDANPTSPVSEPDRAIIIADYRTGIDLQRAILHDPKYDGVRILIITQHDKEWEVRHAVECGVHGYLLQSGVPQELSAAIATLDCGRHYLSRQLIRPMTDSLAQTGLTGREADVLQLLGKGYCNKLIARELGIGLGTVKSHLKGLMAKLNVSARTQAVVVATQRGLLGAEAGVGLVLSGESGARRARPAHNLASLYSLHQ